MNAPLTKQRLGSTHCPECERPLLGGQPVTEVEGDEAYSRKGGVYLGQVRRTTRRWHTGCLRACEARNEENRAEAAAQHERDMREMCEELGLDYDAIAARNAQQKGEL